MTTPTKPRAVQGKTLMLAFVAVIVLVAGVVFWIGMSGGSAHVPSSRPGVAFTSGPAPDDRAAGRAPGPLLSLGDGGRISKTETDRRTRDQLRQRILDVWAAQGEPEVAAAAKAGRFLPAPKSPEGGAMDPKYIQDVVRAEFMPMAAKCYEELLTRKKGARGRFEMSFTIVADERLGAIVEDAEADHGDSGVADDRMTTCMRESLATLSFRPPAQGGVVTVVYPIELSPDDEPPADR